MFRVTSKVLDEKGKKYDSLSSFILTRQAIGSIRSIEKELYSTYKPLSDILDAAVAREFNALVLPSRSGRGAIFDNLEVIESDNKLITTGVVSETKSVKVTTKGSELTASAIKVTTDDGINLSTTKKVFTSAKAGLEVTPEILKNRDDLLETTDVNFSNRLLNLLLQKHAQGQPALKEYLKTSKSKTINALKQNFALKQSDIKVSFVSGGKPFVASIGWTWNQILDPKSKAVISIKQKKDGVFFNVVFPSELVSTALNKANKQSFTKLDQIGTLLATRLAEIPGISPKAVDTLTRRLKTEYNLTYIPGSVRVYNASIVSSKSKESVKKKGAQSFITAVQWTILTQKRLGETMKTFGPPNPPYLKERTGRFRESIEVSPDYRKNLLTYTYLPFYRGLERYGYTPNIQVETAIREVAQSLYTRRFNIRRG
jgi:hypothetical protein